MKPDETWRYIHAERRQLAKTLARLSAEQWAVPSWCAGWSVQQAAGHVVAAAEQTPLNFYRQLAGAGFRFHVFTDRDAKRFGARPSSELVSRLEARTSTTNHPPAPVLAMLGEVIVHGADIRRPLGLDHTPPEAALVAVAAGWARSNLLIGAKRRIAGVRLLATDSGWSHGDGPAVSGPLLALVLAMTGRTGAHHDLSGEGLALLASRP
ncbi:MAG: maleylpyruvate isomerase family mycothiol-dependent enzyme [Acidimicrobiales bacterium]|jgi:uncharacterized protein (TIGR03083 family)